MGVVRHLVDVAKGKHPLRTRRSSRWPAVRREHLRKQPTCAVCGGKTKLQVHHKKPFHLHPELELDPDNLITLCEGKKTLDCHLIFGHLGNFRAINPDVDTDSTAWDIKLSAGHAMAVQR